MPPPATTENKNLVLIGGRGSGKSALARRILRANKQFALFSLDALICCEAGGLTVPEIVSAHGWRHFREIEYQVAAKVTRYPGAALIDCGGGIVVDLDERGEEVFSARKVATLQHNSCVVYLQRDVDYLLARIAGDTNRPSLSDTASFTALMARRDPWYRRAADVVIECGRRTKGDLAREIIRHYRDA